MRLKVVFPKQAEPEVIEEKIKTIVYQGNNFEIQNADTGEVVEGVTRLRLDLPYDGVARATIDIILKCVEGETTSTVKATDDMRASDNSGFCPGKLKQATENMKEALRIFNEKFPNGLFCV